jgi:hypothetical protein
MSERKAFGDFQTPLELASLVTRLVSSMTGKPDVVIEPNVGVGAFLKAATAQWGNGPSYAGYEINEDYAEAAQKELAGTVARIHCRNFFTEDWKTNLNLAGKTKILVLGNPPWVTNSGLGSLGSANLPVKSNFQGLRGFDARTGKANFDIAEWMLIRLIEALPAEGSLAMLCKTMTARKVLRHFWKTDGGRDKSCLFHIDAKAWFGVAVDACLFHVGGRITSDRTATVYDELDLKSEQSKFGYIDGEMVSDIDAYLKWKNLDGGSFAYQWRSGVKHDASQVMEFTREGGLFRNGTGELVELEETYLYPLLKSSDLGNNRSHSRKYVLVTQIGTGADTSLIAKTAPKTWRYLLANAVALDNRKSSIYAKRPRFSVFGIGPYSFAPWKIAISGLYKSMKFVLVPPMEGQPVMVDDTCYLIPCYSKEEAELILEILSSAPVTGFLNSLVFTDSKRPITVDVLKRLSLMEAARVLGRKKQLEAVMCGSPSFEGEEKQMSLLMEKVVE